MPHTESFKQVATSLDIVAWFSKFIPPFSELCEHLYDLMNKRVKWSVKDRESFQRLKKSLNSPSILDRPNFSVSFEVYYDASSVRVGAVLYQKGALVPMHLGSGIRLNRIIRL